MNSKDSVLGSGMNYSTADCMLWLERERETVNVLRASSYGKKDEQKIFKDVECL